MIDLDKFELTFEQRPLYLFVELKGATLGNENAREFRTRLSRHYVESQPPKMLLQLSVVQQLSYADLFFITLDIINVSYNLKVAMVSSNPNDDEAFHFAMRVAKNRGADYGFFENSKRAEEWLLYDA